MDEFVTSLRSDRIIDVYVAGDSVPYKIPESVLKGISDVFAAAIRNESMGGGPSGTLRFPYDNAEAWKMLLWWKTKGCLPEVKRTWELSEQTELVRAWVVGHKYDITEFQDVVMLELLDCMVEGDAKAEAVKEAFRDTPPDSALRKVMAEQVVAMELDWDDEDWNELDGLAEFAREIKAASRRQRYSILFTDKRHAVDCKIQDCDCERWTAYMVGEGPRRHFIHTESSTWR